LYVTQCYGLLLTKTRIFMIKVQNKILILSTLALLAACGDTQGDRALSGAGIGAGVGAVGGAVMGGNPAAGAVVGGVVGAAAGGLTKKKDINLGKPVWR
jgi:osmotically inducible lipoprotein OsmB